LLRELGQVDAAGHASATLTRTLEDEPKLGCVVDCEVESLSSFVKAWVMATLVILGYAWLDLQLNPHLSHETAFSLTPDASRLSDMWDWGGRLLHHQALGLLIGNAVALGGILALGLRGAVALLRRARSINDEAPRVSIVPASVPTSVPPPAP
jgi:hypothetical protein